VRLPRVDNRRTAFLEVPQVAALIVAARVSTQIVAPVCWCWWPWPARASARPVPQNGVTWISWLARGSCSGRSDVTHLSEPAKAVILELDPCRRNDYMFPGEL